MTNQSDNQNKDSLDDGFDEIISNEQQSRKDTPINNSKSKNKKGRKQNYIGLRIYPEDHETVRRWAFFENKTMVEVIADTIAYRKKHDETKQDD